MILEIGTGVMALVLAHGIYRMNETEKEWQLLIHQLEEDRNILRHAMMQVEMTETKLRVAELEFESRTGRNIHAVPQNSSKNL